MYPTNVEVIVQLTERTISRQLLRPIGELRKRWATYGKYKSTAQKAKRQIA